MIRRLNHAVLYVRDAVAAAEFYTTVLGFEEITRLGDNAIFLGLPKSSNDHDLGLFSVGPGASPGRGPGLYHLAWEVDTLQDLADIRERLSAAGALGGASDHGGTKSLYGKDVDGLEFEIMWEVPSEMWTGPRELKVAPLDLDAEIARYGATISRNI